MSVKFSNNGKTTVKATGNDYTVAVFVHDTSVFPTISGDDYFYVTLDRGAGDLEICKVTGVDHALGKLTVERGQEGTTAKSFSFGTKVENRLTAGGLNDVLEQSNQDTLQDVTARNRELTTNPRFTEDEGGVEWYRNTDAASIKFYNDSDGDTNSRLEFNIRDNKNEFFLFTSYDHVTGLDAEQLKIHPTAEMTFRGNKVYDAGDFTNNATDWDTAYSWGDHGTAGYLTSETHADAGYLTSETHADAGYLTSETHADAGYLTSETHADAGYLTSHQDISGKANLTGNNVFTGYVQAKGGIQTNVISGFQPPGTLYGPQQLVLNAGESYGKVGGQTGEHVYINAEGGLRVSTPDSEHANWASGYTVKATNITGESITVSGNEVWHAGNLTDHADAGYLTSETHADAGYITTHQNLPTSLPADGGNSDTVDGKHASDFPLVSNGNVTGDFDNYTTAGNYYVANWNPAGGTPIANGPTYTFNTNETESAYGFGMLRVSNFYAANDNFIVQEYIAHQNDGIWMRVYWSNHGWTAWRQQYTNSSDSNTSGLNADTLDGQEGSYYTGYTDTATTNSGNWDTAYGWGDHSSQGYITSHQSLDNYALKSYVDDEIAGLVDSSPDTLNTLNELAAALGDDPNFATTVTNSIGTKWTQDNTKIGEWDTAYGWGNHASAGYLTSIPYPVNSSWWNSGFVRVGGDGVMEVGKYLDFHTSDTGGNVDYDLRVTASPNALAVGGTIAATGGNSTNWNTAYGWGNHASAGYLTSETHASAGYLTSHQDISGKVDADKGYRTVDTANAVVGPGWITVAKNVSGRKHGEVIVCDKDSGDHAFIRIDFLRSYVDKDFTVLQHGGHSNRITGVRILQETADRTYGDCYLQVYVTHASRYYVKVNQIGDNEFQNHTAVTPVVQDTISGYQVYGAELTGLTGISFACEESIKVGGKVVADNGDSDDWSEAHGWGNHADAGYLTSETHASAGYLTSETHASAGYLTSHQSLSAYATTASLNASNWDTAYGWGNHADAGYAASSHGHEGLKGTWSTIDLNSVAGSDYSFQWDHYSESSTNKPGASTPDNANGVITANTHSSNYRHQIAFHSDEKLYHRAQAAGNWVDWQRILTTADDWDHSSAGYLTNYNPAVLTSTGNSSDLNTGAYRAGMYNWVTTTTGKPADNYGQLLSIVSNGNTHNDTNNWITQLAFGTGQNTAYFRGKTNDGDWGDWKTFFHTGNFTDNSSDWDTAYGWGNHANAGYLTSETHANAGYLTAVPSKQSPATSKELGNVDLDDYAQPGDAGFYHQTANADADTEDNWPNGRAGSLLVQRSANHGNHGTTQLFIDYNNSNVYVRSMYGDSAADRSWKRLYTTSDFTNNSSDWNTAHGWGNHADAGYLTSHQSITGKANLSGATFTGNIARAGTGTNSTYNADTTVMSGYGLMGNRSASVYITNSNPNGSVQLGVGGAHNSSAKLTVTAAHASFSVPITSSGNVIAYSDERLKENVETLDGSKVYEMRGVSFTKDGKANSGVIAQEMQKVAPELVHDDGEYLGVAYGNTIGYLIEAIKDLKEEVDGLKAKLEEKD